MYCQLKQSTAANVVVFMTSSSDHVTGVPGATLTITLGKDGGAPAVITPTVTDRGNGFYNLALTSSHTDTLGTAALYVTAGGCTPNAEFLQVVNVVGADADGLVQVQPGTSTGQLDTTSGRIKANAVYYSGQAVTAGMNPFSINGVVNVVPSINVAYMNGQAPTTPTVTGIPVVDITKIAGDAIVRYDGQAQAGSSSTITLASGSSGINNYYNGRTLTIVAGTGVGQAGIISGYAGGTKVATMTTDWATAPDSTSFYLFGGPA